ncbi:AAA family ATPase [Aeromonas veronii]|uniref:AAA family ATPase n=1 Tax=Aeromonas veronii TaxID=654 RepID=UPI0018F1D8DF|nr:AAA family ATPase [Aeromonas veronii]MBJ7592578.1 AAA family ATPase [Aeromonas veronii]
MGFEFHAVALSGRAAMRLYESIGYPTMTIAALLRNEPIEPSREQPNHLLVIDEASMLDLPTMYRLVNHLHPHVRILLTGDPDQLPQSAVARCWPISCLHMRFRIRPWISLNARMEPRAFPNIRGWSI